MKGYLDIYGIVINNGVLDIRYPAGELTVFKSGEIESSEGTVKLSHNKALLTNKGKLSLGNFEMVSGANIKNY